MKLLSLFKELSLHPKNAEELKGLILQLAVQGKLTAKWREENTSVEPASELLKRIEAEKQQLIAEKKIKKEKPLPPVEDEDKPYELPNSWSWCYLNSLGVIGSSSRVHQKDWQTKGVPFYRAREIVKLAKFGSVNNNLFISEELFEQHKKNGSVPLEYDIMITGVGTIGIPYIVTSEDLFYFKDASVLIFKNIFNLNHDYLKLFFNTPYWKKEIHRESMGTTVHTLTISRAKAVLTIFPPLKEQKAIVEVVNTLFKEVEALENITKERISLKEDFVTSALRRLTESDNTTQEWHYLQQHFSSFFTEKKNIKSLRETILQLAVQGKLTAQWRKTNPSVENASELLKRIEAEKQQLIAEKKIKKEKPRPPIEENDMPYELPEGWVWCRFANITEVLMGQSPPSASYNDKGRGEVLINGPVEFSKGNYGKTRITKYTTHPTKMCNKGDLIVCIRASIGKTNIASHDACIGRGVAAVQPYIEFDYTHNFILANVSNIFDLGTGTTFRSVSKDPFREMLFPLPSIKEQKAIVEKVNSLMALCDELEQQIDNSQTQIEQLMQSCLKEVFEQESN